TVAMDRQRWPGTKGSAIVVWGGVHLQNEGQPPRGRRRSGGAPAPTMEERVMGGEKGSNAPETPAPFLEGNWEDVSEPAASVEKGTGDLYRIPQEALIKGASPIIMKESHGASRLVQISKDPFVTALEARHRCAQYNVSPNF